jgi:hypothetical protein
MSEELSKLKIVPLKKNISDAGEKPQYDDDNAVVAHYNPETISLSKSNKWICRPSIGESVPKNTFSGGDSGSMTLELLFDTTKKGTKVTEEYRKLIEAALVQPSQNKDKKGEPKQVVVKWGKFLSYVAVIESISQTFTFFLPNGTPLRANVTVSLREVFDRSKMKAQNPTSRSEARETWVVEKGQRIEWIAHQAYGQTSAWRHLAETNNILNPTMLRPGQILKITPLPF